MPPVPRDWDASTYDRVSTPIAALGLEVLERLALAGDETVLDAGCGSGRVTEALLARLPRGRVIAVDGSRAMVREAQTRLGDRADVRLADLLELDLGDERVDAILSTATFHWIADHERLFARLRGALRDGGRLVAQCGGRGNVQEVREAVAAVVDAPGSPFAEHLAGFDPWNFAGPEETADRLRAAGFTDVRTWLEDRPVVPDEPDAYVRTMVLGSHADRLPEALRAAFVAEVAGRLGRPVTLGYVRLNVDAVASGSDSST